MQQFEKIVLDINELSTHTLVRLQRLAAQELVYMEKTIGDQLLKVDEWEDAAKQEIKNLKKEQERLVVEKEQLWDARTRL